MGDRSPLSDYQIAAIKEIFSLFDKDNDGIVDIQHLPMMVRGLNQYPTNAELETMRHECDPSSVGYFDFPEFLSLMARHTKDHDPEEELIGAFRYTICYQNGSRG